MPAGTDYFPVTERYNLCIYSYTSNTMEMIMKKMFSFFFGITLSILLSACGSDSGSSNAGSGTTANSVTIDTTSTIDSSVYAVSVASSASTYNSEDIVANTTFAATVTINFDDFSVQTDSDSPQDFSASAVTPLTGVTVT